VSGVNSDAIRALHAEGLTGREIAKELGISASTVSRALASEQGRPAENAVDALVVSLGELDPDRLARVEALRALSRKLDWSGSASTGSAALATAALVREFRLTLDELKPGQAERWDMVTALLAGDNDG
jgi:transcriptional regulator with XRE-family HTH domain